MEDTTNDADFLSLLREIERADASADALDIKAHDADGLLDLFMREPEPDNTHGDSAHSLSGAAAGSSASASHAERCRLNRKRKKQELDELRAAATALEATLAKLTQPPPSAKDDTSASALTAPSALSTWREASRRALLASRNAIAENKKLRELLQSHWAAAQRVQQALHSVPEVELGDLEKRSLKRAREEAPVVASARGLYNKLFQSIHSSYEQNNVSDELSWLKIGVRKISMEMVSQVGGLPSSSFSVSECQRLPFSMAYVSDATWRHLSSPGCVPSDEKDEMCGRSALTSYGNDMFGECGTDCNPPPDADIMPPGRLAIRRYVEPNRLTFVWECDGCFQCDGSNNPIGRVTERGWCTIEPSQDSATSTVFRIQVQYAPHTSEKAASGWCPPQPTLSSDVALDLYRRTIARTFGAVERQVFQQDKPTCHGKACG